MGHLFAAILLFSLPGCPHEESSCITPTEYVEVNLSLPGRVLHDIAARGMRSAVQGGSQT